MTEATFRYQLERMKLRWPRAFDSSFSQLVASEMAHLPDAAFVRAVNHLIGSRSPSQPPLLQDFRSARTDIEKRRFDDDVHGALRIFDNKPFQKGLQNYLNKEFPGCKNIKEAVEVRSHQIQIAKAENPDYDPMSDPRWK